ncbi:hypothetical protein BVX93_00195 [bacterium B13(2017)]|nr:hypothetical protein BVX93_00195 [bacterium B13(2017)]
MIDVVVPVFNEAEGVKDFYNRIKKVPFDANIIFIDNASTDNTIEIIESFKDVKIIKHDKNEGYGASLRDGINSSNNDIILIIDADCEYPPEAIPQILDKMQTSDVVYTSRFLDNKNDDMAFLKKTGNIIISGVFNFLFKQNVTDLYTGCKAFKRSAIEGIVFKRNGFESVLEMAVTFSRKGMKIDEASVEFT